jgi:nitrate reductase delta subunit
MQGAAIYDSLAGLLQYPGEDYGQRAARCTQALAQVQPDAAPLLGEFCRRIEGLSTERLQELFTQTFDLDPTCSLEVGWHLFGEQYERGEFLVRMRQELRRHGLAESTELPDHLTHALAVLGRMELDEADTFAAACVFPALDKMRAGWEGKDNPFENVLEAIAHWLEGRHVRPPAENLPAAPVLRVLDE